MKIKLSSPKQVTWVVALILAALGLIGKVGTVAILTQYAFWLVFAAAALLLLACIVDGL
jgi:hypothetical protein